MENKSAEEILKEHFIKINAQIHKLQSQLSEKESELKVMRDENKDLRDRLDKIFNLFPDMKIVDAKAKEILGYYNGCQDHYYKVGLMMSMAQWIKSIYLSDLFLLSQSKT